MYKIIRYILPLMLAFAMVGCEKLLDIEPTDKLSNEIVFSDLSGGKAALAGAYSMLLSTEIYHTNRMVFPDLVAGNIMYSKTTNVRLLDVYSFIQDAETCSMNATYSAYYRFLNSVNNIVVNAGKLGDSSSLPLRRLEAEALCLRALAHFDLLRLYARPYNFTADASHPGIVINLQPRQYTDPLPQRSTVAQSYKVITDDLETAIRLFANTTQLLSGGYTQNSFNAVSAEALLAKVYLYQHQWQLAYDHADNVIKNGGRTLLTNQQYAASWSTRVPSNESIFELGLESNFAGTTLGTYYGNNGSDQQYAASPVIYLEYSATDVRGLASLFVAQTSGNATYYYTAKYKGAATNATPIKVLRLSDMVLIRAEAAAYLDHLEQAATDLNTIRQRADTAAEKMTLDSRVIALTWILYERKKEFAFEGEYAFDQLRNERALRSDIPYTDDRSVLPIPKSSTDVNPLMEQNKGY